MNPEFTTETIVENRGNKISTFDKGLNVANKVKRFLA